ncbi:MAG TPA: hypothetical protein VGI50_04540 [Solirubrobacteraceae bacterium]
MRDRALHSILEAFTADAAGQLSAETAHGAEIPFELVEAEHGAGRVPLYCYRPLTEAFIDERLGLLSALPTYAVAVRALALVERTAGYLIRRGERRIPPEPRARAELALRTFLRAVFAERSQFGFDPTRFELMYAELEEALYEGQSLTTVISPVLGIALDDATDELALGDGLSLVRGHKVDDAPPEAASTARGDPRVLAMLAVTHDPGRQPPLSLARTRFHRLLTVLRLFERGGYAIGPLAWTRSGTGEWRPIPLAGRGRPGLTVVITADQEDELRAFANLLARRAPKSGEVAWALGRFEMGAERLDPFEALSDYLLALRALLEPEEPDSGLLPVRLAAICVPPEERAGIAARVNRAIMLERAVIAGGPLPEPDADKLVDELGEHLRALLRDVICGHLGADLVSLANELLLESSAAVSAEQPLTFGTTAPYSVPTGTGSARPARHDQ